LVNIIHQSINEFDYLIATIITQYAEIVLNSKSSSLKFISPYIYTETGYHKALNQQMFTTNVQPQEVPPPTPGWFLWALGPKNNYIIHRTLEIHDYQIMFSFHFVDYFNVNGRDIFVVIDGVNPAKETFIVLNGTIKIENKTVIIKNWCRTLTTFKCSSDDNKTHQKEDNFQALDLFWGNVVCAIRGDFASSIKIHCDLEIHSINLEQNKDIIYHPNSWTKIVNT